MLDETTYNHEVAAAFRRLIDAADQVDPDVLDADSTGDMVTLTSARGEKCVINTQRAVRQIWVAGQGQGIHFDFDPASNQWRDDKGKGLELFSFVADTVIAISGVRLPLA
ncbi:MAG: iron donor protein CyaY [Myxococcaceae bacterium]